METETDIMQSETELHKEIVDNIKLKMRLDRINLGQNLINAQEEYHKPYSIEIQLLVRMNLIKTEANLFISYELPLTNSYGGQENDSKEFLTDLKMWCDKPVYVPRSYNRKRQLNSWHHDFKEKTILPSEVEITVYPEAQKYLETKLKISDFKGQIIKLLESQKYANKEETKDFDKWIYLKEKLLDVAEIFNTDKKNEYAYSAEKDETIKAIKMTAKQYNSELKRIEKELTAISERYGWLDMPLIDYKQIEKKPSFKSWKEENESDLTNEWESIEEAKKEFKNYSDFCKYQFKVWLDANSEAFDE